MKITAVIVTRGDHDLTSILNSLPYDETIVWDNSKRDNEGVYGRFLAILEAKHPLIYTQDDDVLVKCHDELQAAWAPGLIAVNTHDDPDDITWVAKGALFERNIADIAFLRYAEQFGGFDHFFKFQACDAILTALSPLNRIRGDYEDLWYGHEPGRMSTTPGWYDDRRVEIRRRCDLLKGAMQFV